MITNEKLSAKENLRRYFYSRDGFRTYFLTFILNHYVLFKKLFKKNIFLKLYMSLKARLHEQLFTAISGRQ